MKRLIPVLILGLCGSASADDITLENGRKLVGIVKQTTDHPNQIIVEMGTGTVTLKRSEVLSISYKKTSLHEYYERLADVKDSESLDDLLDLVQFAKRHQLPRFRKGLMSRILRVDPENVVARKSLGYQKFQGKWMTKAEVYRAKGFVKYKGKWMTTAERALKVSARLDRLDKTVDASIKKAKAKAKKKAASEYKAWAKIIRTPNGYYYRPNWFWPYYYRPYRTGPRSYGSRGGYFGDATPTIDVLDLFTGFGGALSVPNVKKK